MSIATTPNLHLPQWTAEEQPSFLAEINGAWSSIDTGYGDIKTDAATAISASGNAVSIAEAAKQQSQANAGIITQLQQQLAQLEADFINASYLIIDNPVITPKIEGIRIDQYYASHNMYTAQLGFYVHITDAKTYSSWFNTPICNISALPYVWKSLNATVGETIGPVANISSSGMSFYNAPGCTIDANGDVYISIEEFTTTAQNTLSIDVTFSIPIYKSTTSRENIPDNCAILL